MGTVGGGGTGIGRNLTPIGSGEPRRKVPFLAAVVARRRGCPSRGVNSETGKPPMASDAASKITTVGGRKVRLEGEAGLEEAVTVGGWEMWMGTLLAMNAGSVGVCVGGTVGGVVGNAGGMSGGENADGKEPGGPVGECVGGTIGSNVGVCVGDTVGGVVGNTVDMPGGESADGKEAG